MNYEKAYKNALKLIKDCVPDENGFVYVYPEELFPELRESEDEKIRKTLIEYFSIGANNNEITCNIEDKKILSWMEKQGQKSVDKVEPKFHKGDWVVFNGLTLYIKEVVKGYYRTTSIDDIPNSYDWDIDNVARLWTIQDAKDGDVLSYVTDDLWIMIYWSLCEPYEGHVHYHALLVNNNFSDKGTCCICIDNLKPATKEQRDNLLKAMTDAGYAFDFENKELKKIEQTSDWSEEDEKNLRRAIRATKVVYPETADWLKSLKDRIQLQPKQEWDGTEIAPPIDSDVCG